MASPRVLGLGDRGPRLDQGPDAHQPAAGFLVLGGAGLAIGDHPAELGDRFETPVEERVGAAEGEAERDAGGLEIDRLAELLDRARVVAAGHERVSLGAQLRGRGDGARDRSLERGRLLAGGEEQRCEQEQALHA